MTLRLILLGLTLAAAACWSQQRLEISIEMRESGAWKLVDPGHVFKKGDQVRFRFKSTDPGYLYVVNEGTSGDETTLFPTEETGRENRIEAGKEYVIPSTSGVFRVTGPGGYDKVTWLLSPVRIPMSEQVKYKPLPDPPKGPQAPGSMTPRCDDTIFKARGECVDHGAGLKPNKVPGMQARELFFVRKGQQAVVSAPPAGPAIKIATAAPITYQFLIAHQ